MALNNRSDASSRRRSTSSRGFTLRDMLVAVAVLGFLFALMFIGIPQRSVAARRNTCMVNMRHVAMAIALTESARQHYPGYLNTICVDASGKPRETTYIVPLLPHLERMDLYRIWREPTSTPAQLKSAGVYMPVALCP